MDLKSLTEDQFLSSYSITPTDEDDFWKLETLANMWSAGTEKPLPTHAGYALASLTTTVPHGHDVVLLCQKSDGFYEPVGAYCGELVAVRKDHQGNGLGTELILAAAPYRPVPQSRTVSLAGLAALKKAWKVAQTR